MFSSPLFRGKYSQLVPRMGAGANYFRGGATAVLGVFADRPTRGSLSESPSGEATDAVLGVLL